MEHLPAYVIDWDLDQSERGLEKFTAFLSAAGVKFEVSTKTMKPSRLVTPLQLFEEQPCSGLAEGDLHRQLQTCTGEKIASSSFFRP